MSPVYETKDVEVWFLYGGWVVRSPARPQWHRRLRSALESADLLQGDLDTERARERWDAERGNEP